MLLLVKIEALSFGRQVEVEDSVASMAAPEADRGSGDRVPRTPYRIEGSTTSVGDERWSY